jgi:hypothetical protein
MNYGKAPQMMFAIATGLLLLAGTGCGEATDSDFYQGYDQQSQALEEERSAVEVTETTTEETATREEPRESEDDVIEKSWNRWDVKAEPEHGLNGTMQFQISWDANWDEDFTLCLRKQGASGTVCSHFETDVAYGDADVDYSGGRFYTTVGPLECNTTYDIRVKKSFANYVTIDQNTGSCACSNPCPQGGHYDGANCYLGTPPSGTNAFIWQDHYYYTAVGTNSCPLSGTWYDGANCVFQPIPSGVNPFIYQNHFYYAACP